MAALLKLLIGALLDAIIQRLPGWIEEIHKRQAAVQAQKQHAKNAADISAAFSVQNDTEKGGQTPGSEHAATGDRSRPLPASLELRADPAPAGATGQGSASAPSSAVPGGEAKRP